MDMVLKTLQMEIYIMDNFVMENQKVKEHIYGKMEQNIEVYIIINRFF